jgi:ADP-heptose:LPS heptosyltransferase
MKILVISFAGIGDTLMATPLIHELRANFPTARIDILVRWGGARDLLQSNPHPSSVVYKNLVSSWPTETVGFLRGLRREQYDLSFNTYPQSRTAYRFVARFVGARTRLSHVYDNWTMVDRMLVNKCLPQDYSLHAVENNLNLLKLIGQSSRLPKHHYELFLSGEERDWARQFLAGDHRGILGLHVGSGTTKNLSLRRWPIESWILFIERVLREHPDVRVFLFGGPDEREDHAAILGRFKSDRLVAPETKSFRHTAALLENCHAFVSVDTALMHVAAAMKVPHQFVIETPTFNKTVEPYGRPFVLIPNPMVAGRNLEYYRYDGKGIRGGAEHLAECMRSVTPEAVYHRVQNALAGYGTISRSDTSRPTT